MKYRSPILAFWMAALLVQPAFPQAKKPADKKAQVEDDTPPVLAVPPGYRYDSRGRRDPFVNPIPKPVAPPPEFVVVRPEGLRGQLVGEVKVSGIVTSKEPGMNKVMIVVAGKKSPYFAVRGDALFDAVIKEIRPDGVVFTMVSPSTRQPTNREVLRTVGSAGEK